MLSGGRLLQRYVISAIVPYMILAFLLLTAILFAQQTSRFAEILVSSRVPLALFGEVSAALIPSVLIFTVPMAVLTGTVIGFSRLGSDSEMVAIRNAGVGSWSLLWPVLVMGFLATSGAAYLNFQAAPLSNGMLRQAGLEAALIKLNSPIDPRSFNLDIPGSIVYVRDGDKQKGEWGRIFIYRHLKDGATGIDTARTGRLDTTGDQSELVLSDAVDITLPGVASANNSQYVVEHFESLRYTFDTGRKALLDKTQAQTKDIDEANFSRLIEMVRSADHADEREAIAYLHKRFTLSLAPLLFAFLGTSIGLRIRKGGRAMGIFTSIILMLGYYLMSLIGEQMGRAGTIPTVAGSWFATVVTFLVAAVLLLLPPGKKITGPAFIGNLRAKLNSRKTGGTAGSAFTGFWGFPSLLDSSVFRALGLTFATAMVTLTGIFLIFTLFELWRSIAASKSGFLLVGRYLFYLMPFVLIQIVPAATLIAVLATYALMARRSECIAWWASGQSVYRLFLPGILFVCIVGCGVWYLQEKVMPHSNIKQDALRSELKKSPARTITSTGRQWLASIDSHRIFTFDYIDQPNTVHAMSIFEFNGESVHLSRIVRGDTAKWDSENNIKISNAEIFTFGGQVLEHESVPEITLPGMEPFALFKPAIDKPSQLDAKQLSDYIKLNKQRGIEVASLVVALYRKYSEPFGAIVMMLIGAPLALSFGRRNVVAGLCISITVGILFWAASSGFQQLGTFGMLPGAVAAVAPFVIFGSVGLYLLSRTRT